MERVGVGGESDIWVVFFFYKQPGSPHKITLSGAFEKVSPSSRS